jgi:hypothetical protein
LNLFLYLPHGLVYRRVGLEIGLGLWLVVL